MKNIKVLTVLFIIFTVASCHEEIETFESPPEQLSVAEVALRSSQLLKSNPSYLEEMILKLASKYDGDTEVLLHYMNDDFKEQLGWIEKNYLLYEFRMPYSKFFSMNDIETKGLLIAYPEDERLDDRKIERLEAYTLEGEKTFLDREKAKFQPYIILVKSERVRDNIFTYGKFKGKKVTDVPMDESSLLQLKDMHNHGINQSIGGGDADWKNIKINVLNEGYHISVPPPVDEEWWGTHYCEQWGGEFCYENPCIYNGPPPPPVLPTDNDLAYTYKGKYGISNVTSLSKGFTIEKIVFDNGFDSDGWFDGELEVVIEFFQAYLNINVDFEIEFLGFTIPAGTNIQFNSRNLHTFAKNVDEDGATKTVNATYLYHADLASTPIPLIQDFYFYNYTIYIKAYEEDTLFNDDYWGGNNVEISNIRKWLDDYTTAGNPTRVGNWGNGIHIYFKRYNY